MFFWPPLEKKEKELQTKEIWLIRQIKIRASDKKAYWILNLHSFGNFRAEHLLPP